MSCNSCNSCNINNNINNNINKNHFHVGITTLNNNNALSALQICEVLKCKCAQIVYTENNNTNNLYNTPNEKTELDKYLCNQNLNMIVHAPLNINLCSNDINTIHYSKQSLSNIYNKILNLNSTLVFHIGTSTINSINTVAESLNSLNLKHSTNSKYSKQLLAEVSAGAGNQLGKNWDELRKLYESIDTNILGLCLDTQHAFASGLCDFDNHESVVKLFDNVENIGSKICVCHLNDSKVEYKSNVDRHHSIKKGHIWNKNDESLKSLLQICNDKNIDCVLETGSSQLNDLKLLKSYFD